MSNIVRAIFMGDASGIEAAAFKARGAIDSVGNTAEKQKGKLAGFHNALNTLSNVALGGLAGAIYEGIKVNENYDQSLTRLQVGLKNTHNACGVTIQRFQAFADAQAKVTTNTRASIVAADAPAVQYKGYHDTLKLVTDAENLSAYSHISLSAAVKILGKAYSD